jgi:hypothetical protein
VIAGRQYEIYESDTSSESFGDFQSFIELWRSKAPDEGLASWPDFQFEDFIGWYGQLSLFKFLPNGQVDTILWGTKLTDWWGKDLTNHDITTSNIGTVNFWTEGERDYMATLMETRGIGRWAGSLSYVERGFIVIEGIDLPLGIDGEVTHVLSAYINRGTGWPAGPTATPLETRLVGNLHAKD